MLPNPHFIAILLDRVCRPKSFCSPSHLAQGDDAINYPLIVGALYFAFQILRWILFTVKPLMGAMA